MTVPAEVEEHVADSKQMAHLATSVDDRPHVAPVWYDYDDGTVRIVTGGRKVANARENPRVAVSIEESHDGSAAWMVTLLGTAEVVEDRERGRAAAAAIFPKYLGDDVESWDDYYREAVEDGPAGSLLSIDVGSATLQTY